MAAPATAELAVKKSRFIGAAFPVSSPGEVDTVLLQVRDGHPGGSHHAFAYLLAERPDRSGMPLARMSDGGEPSGTAGRPIMSTLERSGLKDVCVVVTRYFGGILLGAPGLVRAYSAAASQTLAAVESREVVRSYRYHWTLPYDRYGSALRLLEQIATVSICQTTYAAEVNISFTAPAALDQHLHDELIHFMQGPPAITRSMPLYL